jgi:hypothetical protein
VLDTPLLPVVDGAPALATSPPLPPPICPMPLPAEPQAWIASSALPAQVATSRLELSHEGRLSVFEHLIVAIGSPRRSEVTDERQGTA